ncbi:MAG TPA: amidase [Symbiobacteriaceae bacterium]|nr:amidase [Symbiobacteriaceae bacterium]
MDGFAQLDALAQAALVQKGEVQPRELVEAAIARIERLNPELNAVISTRFEQVLAEAESAPRTGPFAGVPTLLKEIGPALKGARRSLGSRYLAKAVPNYDSLMVTRMKEAGLLFLGTTNLPEFGILPTTESQAYGPAKNPWNPAHTPGGSSGGAAAAVASGMVPIAHANDGGGSIRIPAANCGLVGLKPSRGRVSNAPEVDGFGLGVDLCLSRSVRDTAAMLDVIGQPGPGDPYVAPAPERPFLQELGRPTGRLRIGFSTTSMTGTPVHADCKQAVRETASLLTDLGHEVEEASPRLNGPNFQQAFLTLWMASATFQVAFLTEVLGRAPEKHELEPLTWAMAEAGQVSAGADIIRAQMTLQVKARRLAAYFGQFDLWLTPVLAEPPLPLGAMAQNREDPLAPLMRAAEVCVFTPIANATGHPAITVPLHWNEAGLPVGVQFMGRPFAEATLLRLAAQLEEARPWAANWPGVAALA